MIKRLLLLTCLFALLQSLKAQTVNILDSGRKVSLRGLSVPNDNVVWASGSKGTVARSVDGGNTFEWLTVKDYETRDFRDIAAFNKDTAIVIAVAEPAVILKTVDGGKSWRKVFEDTTKGMFLDAMDFYDDKTGVVIGDPIDGKLFIAFTENNGDSWQSAPMEKRPKVVAGEACFASSGSNIRLLRGNNFLAVTGGTNARLFYNTTGWPLPIMKGTETTGVNAIAVFNRNIAIVGGDFKNKDRSDSCYLFFDNFTRAVNPRYAVFADKNFSYHSGVTFISSGKIIACGLNGVDISDDNGAHWKNISKESFNAVKKAKNSDAVFLCGSNTKIGRLVIKVE